MRLEAIQNHLRMNVDDELVLETVDSAISEGAWPLHKVGHTVRRSVDHTARKRRARQINAVSFERRKHTFS